LFLDAQQGAVKVKWEGVIMNKCLNNMRSELFLLAVLLGILYACSFYAVMYICYGGLLHEHPPLIDLWLPLLIMVLATVFGTVAPCLFGNGDKPKDE
jgi:H+/Cl- antiporter ClcA